MRRSLFRCSFLTLVAPLATSQGLPPLEVVFRGGDLVSTPHGLVELGIGGAGACNRLGGHAWQAGYWVGTKAHCAIWGSRRGEPESVLRVPGLHSGVQQEWLYLAWEGLDDLGRLTYAEGDLGWGQGARGLWVDNALVVSEGDPVPAMPGWEFEWLQKPHGLFGDKLAFLSRITELATGTTRAAAFLGHDLPPVSMEGDLIAGSQVLDFCPLGGSESDAYRISRSGAHWLLTVPLASGEIALLHDGAVATFQGFPVISGQPTPQSLTTIGIPVFGKTYANWIDDQGEWGAIVNYYKPTDAVTVALLERDELREYDGSSGDYSPELRGSKIDGSGGRVVLYKYEDFYTGHSDYATYVDGYPSDLSRVGIDGDGDGVADPKLKIVGNPNIPNLKSLHIVEDQSLLLLLVLEESGFEDSRASLVRAMGYQLGETYCSPAEANSTGEDARLLVAGSRIAGGFPLSLRAFDLPASTVTLFLASQSSGFVSHPGGSQGNLCLAGQILRFSSQVQTADPQGVVEVPIDTLSIPVLAGSTWHFQGWYRDANPQSTSNFTDAVQIPFD